MPPGLGQAEGIAYFTAVDWVMQHQITDGSFTTTLDVPRAKLDPRKKYAVYVWPGHTSWSADTSTETPVRIGWKALGFPLKAKAAVKVKKPTPKRKGKVTIALSGAHVKPFGKVTVVWAKGAKRKTWSPRLRNGKAAVVLPKTPKGKWKLTMRTAKNPVYKAVQVKRTVRVTR
ncbi:hypothetical protein [Nocardioides sp. TF02-7]|uniref:hypothetical protein n=1 Tax=Nocardioides sp. TF02-7 TaxID=2917724 RepID=UPI001F064B7D|nr:hypothetical protein [Nocardioides sp. TF02-7]UMG93271.1 hypothetical protein MF408_03015 [Nocardioides sp. TF02-7]